MRPRSLLVWCIILVAGPLLARPQEVVTTAEGEQVLAVPEPTFLPEGCIVTLQVGGWTRVANKVGTLTEGLADKRDLFNALSAVENFLLSSRGFPGIHPHRPLFVGLYDPTRIEARVEAPTTWDDMLALGELGVIAVPVVDTSVYITALSSRISFEGRNDDGMLRFGRVRQVFDYEAWAAASGKGEVAGLSQQEIASRFQKIEKKTVFVLPVQDYVLITANAAIAEDCLRNQRPPAWRRVPGQPTLIPGTEVKKVDVIEDGRIIRCQDDLVISIDVASLFRAHRARLTSTINDLKRHLAAEMSSDERLTEAQRVEATNQLAGVIDMYADFILTLLECVDTLEISLAEFQGGVVASASVRPIADSPISGWFTPSGSDRSSDLLPAIPDHFGFACAVNARFDESLLKLYGDLGAQFLPTSNDAGVKAELDSWLSEAVALAKHYTGRMAFGMDFSAKDGRTSFSMLQITELDRPDASLVTIEKTLGPASLWQRLLPRETGLEVVELPKRKDGKTTTEAIEIRRNQKTAATGGNNVLDPAIADMLSGYQVVTGLRGRLSILAVGLDAGTEFDRANQRLDEPLEERMTPRTLRWSQALSPFPQNGKVRGIFDILGFMSTSSMSTFESRSGSKEAYRDVMREFAHRYSGQSLGFHADAAANWATVSFYVSNRLIRGFGEFGQLIGEARRYAGSERNLEATAEALRRYKTLHGGYPAANEGMDALTGTSNGREPIVRSYHAHFLLDAWQRPIAYEVDSAGVPRVISRGRDGVAGGKGFDRDLVLELE